MADNLVIFKKGLQAALPTTGVIENGFYLTTDTHRLYAGIDETHTALLNSAIAFYKDEKELSEATIQFKPAEGDMAFVKDVNALCVYKDNVWFQVNVDTDTVLNGASIVKNSEKSSSSKIVYDVTLSLKDIDGQALTPVTTTFEIKSEDVTNIVTETAVDVNATIETNKATITTSGSGSAGDGFTIVGKDGVTIDGSTDAITIDGTTYELLVNDTTIKLTDNDIQDAGSATIVGDNDWTAAANEDGKIEISHKEKTVSTPDAVTGTITDKKFTVITDITTDKNHVTGIKKSEFTLPNTVYDLGSEEQTLTLSDGKTSKNYTTVVKLIDEDEKDDKVNIRTAHKITVDGKEYIVENGGDFGSFYSASEIDRQHKAIDAMVYKGTVASATDLNNKKNVQIGDTYKASADFDLDNISIAKGDLLIANGTEDENGYVSSVTWDHIESGADDDTQYELSVAADTIILTNTVDTATNEITLGTTEKIELDGTNDTITAIHLGSAADQTKEDATEKGYGEVISVVTAVSTDSTGHATEVKTQDITLPKDDKIVVAANPPKFEIQTDDGVSKGSITIDEKKQDGEDSTPITVTGAISGKNLTVTVEHDTATVTTKPDSDKQVALDGNGNFTVISSIENDGFGHLKTIKTQNITIAEETTYDLSGSVKEGNGQVVLTDVNSEESDIVTLSSETLTYTSPTKNNINIDIVWGNF